MSNAAIVTRSKRTNRKQRASKGGGDAVGQYASDAWSLAKRTAVGLNEIRKLINIETKYIDTIVNSTTVDYNGNVNCLTRVAQGLNVSNRVGDSIKLQHIEVRGRVNISATAVNTTMRVIIFRDLDGYGTQPGGNDVMETNGAVDAPLQPYDYLNKDRFSILFDELFTLSFGSGGGNSSIPFSFSSAHQGHVKYLGTTAAAASDGKGTIYMLQISDLTATNLPNVSFVSRVMYTDD